MIYIMLASIYFMAQQEVAAQFSPMVKSLAPKASEIPGFTLTHGGTGVLFVRRFGSNTTAAEVEWQYTRRAENGGNDLLMLRLYVQPNKASARGQYSARRITWQVEPDHHSFTGTHVGDLVDTAESRQGLEIWSVRDRFYIEADIGFQLIKGDSPKQAKARIDQRKAMMESLVVNMFKNAMATNWPPIPGSSKTIHP